MLEKPYEIAEIYENNTKDVIKYVHCNGAETTLKTVPTCMDPDSGALIDKGKAVLFVSVSTGCTQKCKFCYLTAKNYKFCALSTDTIVRSCIEVIKHAKKILKNKYLKLSFMGMGDVFFSETLINDIVKRVFVFAHSKKYIKGIDGVDIGTSYPDKDTRNILRQINKLKDTVHYLEIPFNPFHNYTQESNRINQERTPVRLFVSLHSLDDKIRKYLMPKSASISKIIREIQSIKVDVIFHYILFDKINDSENDIAVLTDFFENSDIHIHELRLLRYNSCPNLDLKESLIVDDAIKELKDSDIRFKYQLSAGREIAASCGQFLCKEIKK